MPDNDAVIRTDKEKLDTILINLVKNAIKFTRKGFIEFGYILTQKGPKTAGIAVETEELEFFVKDSGGGISPENLEFIFERFRQGSESLNRNYEGIGLGLAISKADVEMLDGKIWVESEPEKGSEFYFTLPYNTEPK